MSHLTLSENWVFEITAVRARKVKEFGKPYSAIATISYVDGEVHVEGLIARGKYSREDTKEIERFIKEFFSVNEYFTSHFKNGERVKVQVEL